MILASQVAAFAIILLHIHYRLVEKNTDALLVPQMQEAVNRPVREQPCCSSPLDMVSASRAIRHTARGKST